MSVVETILGEPAALAVGWALMHFVWQGAVIGVLAYAVLTMLRRSAADVRYVVSTVALSLMLIMPILTGLQVWRGVGERAGGGPGLSCSGVDCNGASRGWPDAAARRADVAGAIVVPSTSTAPDAPVPTRAPRVSALGSWLPLFMLGWVCGVMALTLRLLSGWMWVRQMPLRGTSPVGETCHDAAGRLARRLHIARPVRLLQSTLVDVPTVVGWLKPVVLLPAGMLAGLAPAQLEAILAHELAHIRRHDYCVNLLQTVVETLLFYHPAVWWISREIRVERENCCDDLAVRLCGDPVTYAQALADLEDLRGCASPLALAATGGSLLQRVARVLGAPTHAGRAPGWLAGSLAVLLMSGIAAGAVNTQGFASTALAALDRSVAPRAAVAGGRLDSRESNQAPVRAEMAPSYPASIAAHLVAAVAGPSPRSQQTHRSFNSSINGEKLQVKYVGEVEFTDDDTDVKRLSPGAWLRIKDGWLFPANTVDFSVDRAGNIRRRYWAGMSERPFDPDGRRWTATVLPGFIRQTGAGAPARVKRILEAKGPAGVLSDISLIEGGFGKRIYFTELLKTPALDAGTVRQILGQASREIDSDYELASLLIDNARAFMTADPTGQAYFEAARTIDSDYEMRRVFSTALTRGAVDAAALASLLGTSRSLESDFEAASLLVDVAKSHPLDGLTREPFFSALRTIDSDFEHRRVLGALASRPDLAPETTAAMLASISALESDFEAASFLLDVVKHHSVEGALRTPFFRGVDSVGSSFERGRVLQEVVARRDASTDTVVEALRSARTLDGSERANVLLVTVRSHRLEGPARDAYIASAEGLGDHEQGTVFAALVKAESRR